MDFSTLVGLAMVAAAVVMFVMLLPRRGLISPLLRSDNAESMLAMVFVLLIVTGAAVALFGFPLGLNFMAAR